MPLKNASLNCVEHQEIGGLKSSVALRHVATQRISKSFTNAFV